MASCGQMFAFQKTGFLRNLGAGIQKGVTFDSSPTFEEVLSIDKPAPSVPGPCQLAAPHHPLSHTILGPLPSPSPSPLPKACSASTCEEE